MAHRMKYVSASSDVPADLAQLVGQTSAREDVEGFLQQAHPSDSVADEAIGSQYLLFTCGGVQCAVALRALREVLPQVPAAVPLPHSPPWTLGVFALRSELIALVDPAPVLLGERSTRERVQVGAALLVGKGPRTLGWAVGDIGAIRVIRPEEISPLPSPAVPVWERYALGVCTPASAEDTYVLLDADRLLDDLLNELEERERSNG
jgi:chemotaxis signal transduction protein